MGTAHHKSVGKNGAGVKHHPWTEHDFHQVESQEPEGLGRHVGEFGYDRPGEVDQGNYF